MDASETRKTQATSRDVSAAGDSDAQVVCEQTQADIVPLFADEDTFVERAAAASDRAVTEPFAHEDDEDDTPDADPDLELAKTRRQLDTALVRAKVAEQRSRELTAELARQRAEHEAIVKELECHGASAVAATYLWFVRNSR